MLNKQGPAIDLVSPTPFQTLVLDRESSLQQMWQPHTQKTSCQLVRNSQKLLGADTGGNWGPSWVGGQDAVNCGLLLLMNSHGPPGMVGSGTRRLRKTPSSCHTKPRSDRALLLISVHSYGWPLLRFSSLAKPSLLDTLPGGYSSWRHITKDCHQTA